MPQQKLAPLPINNSLQILYVVTAPQSERNHNIHGHLQIVASGRNKAERERVSTEKA